MGKLADSKFMRSIFTFISNLSDVDHQDLKVKMKDGYVIVYAANHIRKDMYVVQVKSGGERERERVLEYKVVLCVFIKIFFLSVC